MAARIRKGDRVMLIAGKDKGRTGQVAAVMPKAGRAMVTGLNLVRRHVKPSQADPQGGIKVREAPVHLSNLALVDSAGKPTRVGFRVEGERKVRFARTNGESIDG